MHLSEGQRTQVDRMARVIGNYFGIEIEEIQKRILERLKISTLSVSRELEKTRSAIEDALKSPLIHDAATKLSEEIGLKDVSLVEDMMRHYIVEMRNMVGKRKSRRPRSFQNDLDMTIAWVKSNRKNLLDNDGNPLPDEEISASAFHYTTGGGRRVIRSTRGMD